MIRPPSECVELRIFLAEFPERIRVCRAGQLRQDGLLHAQTFLLLAQGLLLHCQALMRHLRLGLDELLLHFAHRVQWNSGGFLPQGPQKCRGSGLVDQARSSDNKALNELPSDVSLAAAKALIETPFGVSWGCVSGAD